MLWRDKYFLVEKYMNQDMTCKEIGDEVGCNWSTVLKWVNRFDIKKRRPGTRKGVYYAHNRNGHYEICKQCGNKFWVIPAKPMEVCSFACKLNYYIGENHWCWKGGTQKYRGDDWIEISRFVRDRDDYSCRRCGECSMAVATHHVIPYQVSKSNCPRNLLVLCPSCHRTIELMTMQIFPEFYNGEGELRGSLNVIVENLRKVILSQAVEG